MLRSLPVEVSVGSVKSGSSEPKFEASVSSTMVAWASEEKSHSGSWVSSYVSSTSGVISIWNAKVEILVKCLSIAFLH